MKIISCINDKGGSGKSTTIANLAGVKALQGYKVLVIDLDGKATVSGLLGVDTTTSRCIGSLMEPDDDGGRRVLTEADILACIQTSDSFTAYTKGSTNLCVIPSNSRINSIKDRLKTVFDDEVLKYILSILNNSKTVKFDYVFLDCPGELSIITLNALAVSDRVIVPSEATLANEFGLANVFKYINNMAVERGKNPDLPTPKLLINRVRTPVKTQNDICSDFLQDYEVIGIVRASADVNRNDYRNLPVSVAQRSCQVSQAYWDIAEQL